MSLQTADCITQARAVLRGRVISPAEALALAKQLQQERAFGYAWRILAKARKDKSVNQQPHLRLKLAQEQSFFTYKDPDLPNDSKLQRALDILWEVEDLKTTRNQGVLSNAGAIHKRMWEVYSLKHHLERSLSYYLRAYDEGVTTDRGYSGINAAYVIDLLAYQEDKEAHEAGYKSAVAQSRREQAEQIRRRLVAELSQMVNNAGNEEDWELDFFLLATISEAYIGLREPENAKPWLEKAASFANVESWQYESTARQLASLAMLVDEGFDSSTGMEGSAAWNALTILLQGNIVGVRTAILGKVGLALSGGGFRASLFHIGVLAKLAELDMLRHVEVLSCVSGGSIIGAHYYLEARKLLQEKEDSEITRDDYIEIVRRLEKDFLTGVQRNIRTRVLASLKSNLKMIFKPNYSRTERVGELYESEIYSKVNDGHGGRARWLDELLVRPKGYNASFNPKNDNWRRAAKVPNLILNATPLNTGHNWHFTASWMGEAPASTDSEIDANYRLRRMYYSQAPEGHRKVRLGHAVAASSCVPGLFDPINFTDLYPDMVVRLVDGGVHDNQGVAALLEQGCTVLLVSDASGQMYEQDDPSAGILSVPLRTNSILMARVRNAQFLDLVQRRRVSLLQGLMFIHLKKDLHSKAVDWINCEEPSDDLNDVSNDELTSYGIIKEVQERLSAIRTDLDSFSDKEAFALMTSGYRMTEHEFARCITGFPKTGKIAGGWNFLAVEEPMKRKHGCEAEHKELMEQLEVAKSTGFKIWKLSRALRACSIFLAIVVFIALVWVCWNWRSVQLLTVGVLSAAMAGVILIILLSKLVIRARRLREFLMRVCIGSTLLTLGWFAALIHLGIFDKLYLRRGQVAGRSPASVNSKTASVS